MTLRKNTALRVNNRSLLQTGAFAICLLTVAIAFVAVRQGAAKEIQENRTEVVVGEFDVVSLPVPVSFVPAGTLVRDVQFKQIKFPKQQVPEGALHSIHGYLEAATIAGLPANLPVFKENFSLTASAHNPVIERIPPGMRAMTVKVDATSAVEGWAGSGSVVDVLLVERDRTIVIAEKVKVLSAERSVAPVEGAAAPSVPSTVTLLVTQDQCLAINTAVPRGKLAFALRSTADQEGWADTLYTAERLRGGDQAAKQEINGYVSVKELNNSEGNSSYALSDGKWIKTEVVPQGFFPAKQVR